MVKKAEEFAVGKDVLSYCGKCKMPMGHIIVSLTKKGTVDKCECQTCKAVHKYRNPETATKKPTKKRTTRSSAKSAKALWEESCAEAKGPLKPYAMSAEFTEGDVIDHATFGRGVVRELVGHHKMKVLFEEAEKLLVHNRE